MSAVTGPLISQPVNWMLVFDREASCWWASAMALGRFKHVRAFGYVPFLHVWVFFDPHLAGTEVVIAADGEPAQALIQRWIVNADVIRMPARRDGRRRMAVLGFCVPTIKRLMGLRCGALRPDGLHRYCLRNGGERFDAVPTVSATGARPGLCADDGRQPQG
jgi:hypothetical protein